MSAFSGQTIYVGQEYVSDNHTKHVNDLVKVLNDRNRKQF